MTPSFYPTKMGLSKSDSLPPSFETRLLEPRFAHELTRVLATKVDNQESFSKNRGKYKSY